MGGSGGDRGRATLRAIFDLHRSHPELSGEERSVWVAYRSYQTPGGEGAFPGLDTLSDHLGLAPRTIRRHRRNLLDKGYLRRTLRGPQPAAYRAVLPEGEDREPPDPPEEEGPGWPTVGNLEKSESGEFDYPPAFEGIWSAYPRQKGKKAAYEKVRARVNEGVDPELLQRAARLYGREMEQEGRESRFIKLPATFFGPKDWWREQLQDGAGGESPVTDLDRQQAALDALDGGNGE